MATPSKLTTSFLIVALAVLSLIAVWTLFSEHGHKEGTIAFAEQTQRIGNIEVGSAFVRPTFGNSSATALYLTITNHADTDDRLVAVSAEVAKLTEIHQTKTSNGVTTMRPMSDGVPIAAAGVLEMAPGGYHIMLRELSSNLSAGDNIHVTLTLMRAGSISITVPVSLSGPATSAEHAH